MWEFSEFLWIFLTSSRWLIWQMSSLIGWPEKFIWDEDTTTVRIWRMTYKLGNNLPKTNIFSSVAQKSWFKCLTQQTILEILFEFVELNNCEKKSSLIGYKYKFSSIQFLIWQLQLSIKSFWNPFGNLTDLCGIMQIQTTKFK